ncbi:MAG: ABC transporter ATP-binding protein [Acidimicrobiales bacterium]
MDHQQLFPTASTRATAAHCWRQMQPDRVAFAGAWAAIVLGTLANAVAGPLIFATLLGRIADLRPGSGLWSSFGPLVLAYALVLASATVLWRIAGWVNWGATLRAFARAITNGYGHLIGLSHRWHTDRPAGEVISALETFSWAFVEIIDMTAWGVLRVGVTVLGAIAVLGVVAWPVSVVMAVLVLVFGGVLWRRMARVVSAEQEFSDTHSRATGVIADTIANLTAVRTQAAEHREMAHVASVVADSVRADLRARRVFSATRLQMESSMAALNWVAIVVGLGLALHHVVAAAAVYLILFYATFVGGALEESFEFVRAISRAAGRCAKFVAIAGTEPEIRDAPGARPLVVTNGRVELRRVVFAYRDDAPLFEGLDLEIAPGEHVGLVGPSGSGKTTLTKLVLRFMDVDGGTILLDGQDVSAVTQDSLRRQISYVPQDPLLLHRSIAENICYGVPGLDRPDLALVAEVGRAANVEEFVRQLPDGYQTVVGERGLKLSGGQRQRVAIAQAMAKAAPLLILDEATSALDSESESLVQEALWRLMDGSTAVVVAHRLATIARLDRIVVMDRGRVVEEGTHDELLARTGGLYHRLWQHQSGGFLPA